jgi:hypothetical protein
MRASGSGVAGQLTGPDVIVVHRLLKNGVEGSGYVLMTESFAAAYGLSPEQLGFSSRLERYGDVGEVCAASLPSSSAVTARSATVGGSR